jgi:hypothetical protein
MPAITLMLGSIGSSKNGTAKTEIHFEAKTGFLQLHQESGYVVASLKVKSARVLAAADTRWNVAVALYDLHVGSGKIIK